MDVKITRDRDYIQDLQGDIFQVISSLHPENGIYALQKYKKVSSEISETEYDTLMPEKDPISQIKQHQFRFWIQKETQDHFIRILPNYSSTSAQNNIKRHPYRKFSSIFQMELIQIPENQIKTHWYPEDRFNSLFSTIQQGDFAHKLNLDKIEREAIEAALQISDIFSVEPKNFGLTGSILWDAHHELSDIDLMLYGADNWQKFFKYHDSIDSDRRGIRSYKKIEILPLAEKMALKTGLPMEECFEQIYNKPYHFFFNKRKISITFAPKIQQIPYYPLYLKESVFKSLGNIIVKAKVIDDLWGFFYPGLFQVQIEEIISKFDVIPNQITRLIIYEHEMVGFYRKGDIIEIRGLLQFCTNVIDFSGINIINTYQILIGGFESFGAEYIRKIE